jgi:hypothetical protein
LPPASSLHNQFTPFVQGALEVELVDEQLDNRRRFNHDLTDRCPNEHRGRDDYPGGADESLHAVR